MDAEEVEIAEELLRTVGRRITNKFPIHILGYETFCIDTVSEARGQEDTPCDFVSLWEVREYVQEQKSRISVSK